MIETLLELEARSWTWVHVPGAQVVSLRPNGRESGVDALERALRLGVEANADPRRRNFYEASIGGYRHYFHVSPAHPAKVYLLARWPEM